MNKIYSLPKLNLLLIIAFLSIFSNGWTQTDASPVITATATEENFSDVVEALGTLKANNSVTITSEVTELVTEIHIVDGQRVKKGDLLISMDTSDETALLLEEQAKLDEARRQVDRLMPLAAQNATSKSALDTQRSTVDVAEARIQGIQSQINKRKIRAPFDGVIGLINISVGTLAQPGIELATIDDDLTMKMDFSIPETHLSYLFEGLKIEAQTQAFPNKIFTGEVASINSRINPNTRAVQVRAIIQNPDQLLKPGILMRIKLATQTRTSLLIPEEGITSYGNEQKVFKIVKSNNTTVVKQQLITIGSRYGGKIEVLSGLQAGDLVVIHGALKLNDGSTVHIVANKSDGESLADLLAKKTAPNTSDTSQGS